MSGYLVLDCSFFVAITLPDEKSECNDISSYSIIVPSIFYLECINVLQMSLKRSRINSLQLQEYANMLRQFPCEIDKYSSSLESIFSITKLCNQYDLTSYDAAYLELAIRYGAKVATHDRKLLAACQKANIVVITSL